MSAESAGPVQPAVQCGAPHDQSWMWTVVPIGAQANIQAIAACGKCTQPCEPSVRYFGLPYGNFCHGRVVHAVGPS